MSQRPSSCPSRPICAVEPRIVLENSNPFTIDAVTIHGGTSGDCIIQFPQVGKVVTRYEVVSVVCERRALRWRWHLVVT